MAVIKSGATTDELTVDPTSKAARVTLYDSQGNLIEKEYSGSYVTKIEIIPSTLTAATTYFAMRNLGASRAFIRKIFLKLGFSGTAAATRSIFEIGRFSTATPTGGTSQTALKKDNTYGASSVTDIRFAAAGLTTTSVVFENPFHLLGPTNQLNDDHVADLVFGPEESAKLVLAVNEGLCIRANTAIVAGAHIIGSIHWDERT